MNERDHKDNQEASWIQLIINVSYKVVEVLFRPLDLEHHPVKTEFPLELKKVVEISSKDLRETNTGLSYLISAAMSFATFLLVTGLVAREAKSCCWNPSAENLGTILGGLIPPFFLTS